MLLPKAAPFTVAAVRKMHCPAGRSEAFFWDTAVNGLGIRALASGRRSWVMQYRDEHGRTRRIALGDLRNVDLDAARAAARQHSASIVKGGNPAIERKAKRHAVTVVDIIKLYLPFAGGKQRPRSFIETKRHLEKNAASLHHERAEGVRRANISALLEKVAEENGKITANRTRAALSAMGNWALRDGRLTAVDGADLANPRALTMRRQETSRDRELTDQEVKALWTCTGDSRDHSRACACLW
jgi:hypothetical protein